MTEPGTGQCCVPGCGAPSNEDLCLRCDQWVSEQAAKLRRGDGRVQRAWDSVASLPPIEFSEAEEAALLAHLDGSR